MKHIQKTNEPVLFTQWKIRHAAEITSIGDNAKDLWRYWGKNHEGVKSNLKDKLLSDQGFICCYCMQRIENNEKTVIEHLEAKSNNPQQLTFNFQNLLASCHGEGRTPQPKDMHCDGNKQLYDQTLPINPLMPGCENHFKFTQAGEILYLSQNAKDTIDMLNLKALKLDNLREAAIEQELKETVTREKALERVSALIQAQNGRFTPFCMALISVLSQEFSL